MVTVMTAVEAHLRDTGGLGLVGEQLAHGLRRGDVAAIGDLALEFGDTVLAEAKVTPRSSSITWA